VLCCDTAGSSSPLPRCGEPMPTRPSMILRSTTRPRGLALPVVRKVPRGFRPLLDHTLRQSDLRVRPLIRGLVMMLVLKYYVNIPIAICKARRPADPPRPHQTAPDPTIKTRERSAIAGRPAMIRALATSARLS
jgi:hypothetical protein